MGNSENRRSAFKKSEPEKHAPQDAPVDERNDEPSGGAPLQLPEKIKIDIDTLFEQFLMIAGLVFIAASLVFLYGGLAPNYDKFSRAIRPPERWMLYYVPLFWALSAAAFYCRSNANNYYVLDTREKKLYYHFNFFGYSSARLFISAENIRAVSVNGIPHNIYRSFTWSQLQKNRGEIAAGAAMITMTALVNAWLGRRSRSRGFYGGGSGARAWQYNIVIIDDSGRIFDISDYYPEALEAMNEQARGIAQVLGCGFVECPGGSMITVNKGGDSGCEIIHDQSGVAYYEYMDNALLIGSAVIIVAAIWCFLIWSGLVVLK